IRKLSDTAADALWGLGGITGRSKLEEAEIWAAMIEQQYLVDDNYVDVGLITQLKGELDGGVAALSLEASYKRLSHYDKDAINRKSGGMHGLLKPSSQQAPPQQSQTPSSSPLSISAKALENKARAI